MNEKMLKFISLNQANPEKRGSDKRNKDFKEIYNDFVKCNAELNGLWS